MLHGNSGEPEWWLADKFCDLESHMKYEELVFLPVFSCNEKQDGREGAPRTYTNARYFGGKPLLKQIEPQGFLSGKIDKNENLPF